MFEWPEPRTALVSSVEPPEDISRALYFVCKGQQIFQPDGEQWEPLQYPAIVELGFKDDPKLYLGLIDTRPCFAIDVTDRQTGLQFDGLRSLLGRAAQQMFAVAGRATQIVDWSRTHAYCGRCGGKTDDHEVDRAKECAACELVFYPRLSPSMIVLVRRGEEVLLARNQRFPEGMFSTLAGFVEPGESVEQTVRREVMEEVGLTVENIRYLGSQSWPFPNSLMLGFHCDHLSGEIAVQEDELAEARWFHFSELPNIPGKDAISRWLIDSYLVEMGAKVSP